MLGNKYESTVLELLTVDDLLRKRENFFAFLSLIVPTLKYLSTKVSEYMHIMATGDTDVS